MDGVDYIPLMEEPLGNFSRTQRRQCLTVTIMDDEVCEEPEESFSLSISMPEFVNTSRGVVNIYIRDSGEVECSKPSRSPTIHIVFVLKLMHFPIAA